MKRIGLIVFALLALAIATPVVLVVTLPTAKVTIVAIRPTGKVFTIMDSNGDAVSGQEWLFGITNAGQATALWTAAVHSRPLDKSESMLVPMIAGRPNGTLRPGEGLVTNMMVGAGDKTEWSGWVQYGTAPTPFQRHLWFLGEKTPGMRRLSPPHTAQSSYERTWHPATNATMASSTVTNTP